MTSYLVLLACMSKSSIEDSDGSNNERKEWNENQVGGSVLRSSLRIRERRLAKFANTLGSGKEIKKDENGKDTKGREKRRTNSDRSLTSRRSSPSSGTEVCDEQPSSNRQSMEITRQRPHSLQLGASSQEDTKPSVAKSPHTNKKRTMTRALPSFTNHLSPSNKRRGSGYDV
ncbi:unnamed protein product [Angiostrongylus costaricensis]|uniref:DUF4005 domain-containing protein n=1 Tax=Angiostrongylus costaricensis TaxID=334426 RepID=A0A158PMM4_ANGCS|nr:unnamed protein product [Angiostrongylus costaricensis]